MSLLQTWTDCTITPSTLVPTFAWQAHASGAVQISLIRDIGCVRIGSQFMCWGT